VAKTKRVCNLIFRSGRWPLNSRANVSVEVFLSCISPTTGTACRAVQLIQIASPRSLASSISPAFAGMLLTLSFAGLPLVFCGSLKIVYDLALLYSFRHIKPPEEKV
jgi:hypothetical protein